MGILISILVDVHLTQLLLLLINIGFVSYSSGYMQQIGTFCRSQTRQTQTTLFKNFIPYMSSTNKCDVLKHNK